MSKDILEQIKKFQKKLPQQNDSAETKQLKKLRREVSNLNQKYDEALGEVEEENIKPNYIG